ncbi:complement C1q and tumor necrosis factor-related protein 9A-like [Mercenaria mercenaria]|uniref:complement C1q and tumor necrosis factor-related protein 9A-like n=1 Tax=Mercenaria mercenaria TaxID=6596 RepID=UPI00234E7E8C|nr:complement C1q and tumor necrosis factor-related protein 9A-like [Mercenaria mercenaria]
MEISFFTLSIFCFSGVYLLPIGKNVTSYGEEITTNPTEGDIKLLKEQVSALTQTVLANEKKIADLTVLNADKLLTQQDQTETGHDIRTLNSDVIGFTAVLKEHAIDLPTGSTIVYDNVYYNAGNAYDTSTGVFTCPRSGLYLFYINVEPFDESLPAAIAILINGSYRVDAVAERYDVGHDSTGGNMMVEHLQEGDRVWVETYEHDNQDLYKGFTSFSGVLIRST